MSNDLSEIKVRLLNENKITTVLEKIGCEHVKPCYNRIEAQLPFDKFQSPNVRSVQCKLRESLSCVIRNLHDFKGGDIFSLVSFIYNDCRTEEEIKKDLSNAKRFICDLFGWKEYLTKTNYKQKIDYLYALRELQINKKRKYSSEPNRIIPEITLEEFIPFPSHAWYKEGISLETQQFYQIGFDLHSNRITIPIRNKDGQLVGVKGRIIEDELDDKKYLYLHKTNMSQELFNFYIAKESIKEKKKVIIFESEKSCLMMHSNGIYNTVAIGSSSISETQAKLIKSLGIDVQIVIAFDKDKTIEDIKNVAKAFSNRPVYAIFDTKGILGDKQSPIDRGIEVFNQLEEECCYLVNGEITV